VDGKGLGTDLGPAKAFAWSPDGTEIAASDFTATDGLPDVLKPAATHFVVDVKTGKKTALGLPDDHILTDWSRDGKYLVTTRLRGTKGAPSARVFLMNRDGTEHRAVTDGKAVAMGGMLSPDRRRMMYMEIELPKDRPPVPRKLVVADVASGAATAVEGIPLDAEVQGYCWSPDGRRVAYTWGRTINDGTTQAEAEAYLVVCDPDGRNERTVVTDKHPSKVGTLLHVDWR
jgi:Tol biopolymer transport system component